jgi:hypothetical protein
MPAQPKPRRSTRSKKIHVNKAKTWKGIIEGVDKNQVPVHILQEINVKLVDGTIISIDVRQLLTDMLPSEVEELLDNKFHELDMYIENIDFMIDLDKVVDTVQPETDKILKGL